MARTCSHAAGLLAVKLTRTSSEGICWLSADPFHNLCRSFSGAGMFRPDISRVTTQIYCFNSTSDALPQITFFSPDGQIKVNFPEVRAECYVGAALL